MRDTMQMLSERPRLLGALTIGALLGLVACIVGLLIVLGHAILSLT